LNKTLDLNDKGSEYVNIRKIDSGEGPTVPFLGNFQATLHGTYLSHERYQCVFDVQGMN